MRIKDKYVNVLEGESGNSLGVRRLGERISTRWWFVGDHRENAVALVHAAVDAAFEQAQAAHDAEEASLVRAYEGELSRLRSDRERAEQAYKKTLDRARAAESTAAQLRERIARTDACAAPPVFLFSDAEEVNKLKTEIARLESVAKARDSAIQNLTAERDQARADNAKVVGLLVEANTKYFLRDREIHDLRNEVNAVQVRNENQRRFVREAEDKARSVERDAAEARRSAERAAAEARRQYTDAFREAEDLRARLNGALADKTVLQRKLEAAQARATEAEAKLRAAARGGGHAMGQDSSEERARDLDPVRRPGLRPGEGSWTRMARVFVEDSQVASVANAILEEQAKTSVKVNEIVHRHGFEALDHALRDARYKHGGPVKRGVRFALATILHVHPLCGRRVLLDVAAHNDIVPDTFVDVFRPGAENTCASGPAKIETCAWYCGSRRIELELHAAGDYVLLCKDAQLYLAP